MASPRGMKWRILFKNCEASLGELNPLEGLNRFIAGLAMNTKRIFMRKLNSRKPIRILEVHFISHTHPMLLN